AVYLRPVAGGPDVKVGEVDTVGRTPLGPDQDYTLSGSFVAPVTAPGAYYVVIRTDVANEQGEYYENNNEFVTTSTVNLVSGVISNGVVQLGVNSLGNLD